MRRTIIWALIVAASVIAVIAALTTWVRRQMLDEQAWRNAGAELIAEPKRTARLEGHADARGSREYNVGLGERRAQAVRQFLILNGVPQVQIVTVSYGEERPAVQGDDEAAWSRNRRVEIVRTNR